MAAVGPPEHAVGRRPAGRPRRGRHRARPGRRTRGVRRPAGLGRRTSRCGGSATGRTSGRCTGSGRTSEAELVVDVGSDIAGPQWVFGQSRFALLADGRVAFAYGRDGADRLAVLEADGSVRELDVPFSAFRYITAQGTAVVCVAGSPTSEPVVLRVDVDGGEPEILRPARDLGLDPAWFSRPEHVTLPDRGPRHGHRRRARARLPADQPGGGRTRRRPAAADGRWCTAARPPPPSRCSTWRCSTGPPAGFCVADVDYRGSVGYGRRYRDALQGRWGVVDLDDVVACARHLADSGRVDPARMAIRGGSAGGYTTLAALTMRPGRLHRRRQPLRRRRPRRAGRRDAQVRVALPRRARGAVAVGCRRVRRALPDQPRRRARHPAGGVPGRRGRRRAARPGGGDRRGAARRRACRTPTCSSRASSTASGRRRTSARALDGELSFYAQVWGFDLPADEGIDPIEVIRAG